MDWHGNCKLIILLNILSKVEGKKPDGDREFHRNEQNNDRIDFVGEEEEVQWIQKI